ncbi:hypothetical protein ACFQYP_18455 [Nonomuraea antimicrobica]
MRHALVMTADLPDIGASDRRPIPARLSTMMLGNQIGGEVAIEDGTEAIRVMPRRFYHLRVGGLAGRRSIGGAGTAS